MFLLSAISHLFFLAIFVGLFTVFIVADREQFVSDFWAKVHRRTETRGFDVALLVAATMQWILALTNDVIPGLTAIFWGVMGSFSVVGGAFLMSVWAAAGLFATAVSISLLIAAAMDYWMFVRKDWNARYRARRPV